VRVRNFSWDFFQEEVEQVQRSNFIQDWIEQAEKRGIQQGRQEGLQQGALQKAQSILVRQLRAKFGRLPRPMEKQIRTINSEEELDQLSLRVLTANRLDEMGLNGFCQ
jgi:flagellar biosynthesis/type III secretory pathway protein FliH